MAATTTAVLQANVLKKLQMDYADSTLLARALQWLNEALDMVQGYIPEAEFLQKSEIRIATVADQSSYALPSDFFQLLELRDDTNKTMLEMLAREQFDRNHPDPSSEDTGKPYEYSLEFDRSTDPGTHILRLAAIPDDAYTLYAVMRAFHPDLANAGQTITWEKLQTPLENMAAYYGAMEFYKGNEHLRWRAELNQRGLTGLQNIRQLLMIQKPHRRQIPVVMRKEYC